MASTLQELLQQRDEIEAQLNDPLLPHSDQQLLEQGLEEIELQIEQLEDTESTPSSDSYSDMPPLIPARPPTPIPDDVEMLDMGGGFMISKEELEEINRWKEREDEGWEYQEATYDPAGEI